MALIIITVELSIDSLHTIVGNPKNSISPRRPELAFGGFTCKVWGLGSVEKACGLNYLFLSEHL